MKHAVILDIGSSKVVCLCGSRVGLDGVAVHGAGIQSHPGYRFGRWIDPGQTQTAIIKAVEAAERECGFRFKDAAITVPMPFMQVRLGQASIEISDKNAKQRRITNADIDMLINESLPEDVEADWLLTHSTPIDFLVDGSQKREIPIGITAGVLSGGVSHAYMRQDFYSVVQAAMNDLGLEPSACIAAPLSQALLLMSAEEREKPSILVDVGYLHTDICLVENEALLSMETVEMGGMHFASDLSQGLELPMSVTEPLKRRYTFSLDYQDSVELLRTPEGTRQVERKLIQMIIEERAKELCAMIYECLLDMGVDLYARPAMHLTGGGVAMMRGSQEFFERMLGLRISRETPWMPRMSSPNYTSVYGTLEFLLHAADDTGLGRLEGVQLGRARKKIMDFFRK